MSPVYAITDRRLAGKASAADLVDIFFKAGIRTVQIREKDLCGRELLEETARARGLAVARRGELFINDRPDIARIVGCGVHLGEDDLPAPEARLVLGETLPIGVSTHDPAGAARAFEAREVDYVAFGPVFPTAGKPRLAPRGLEALAEVAKIKTLPLVAIGGIGLSDLDAVWDAGADSAAMISALNVSGAGERAAAAMDTARRRLLPRKIWLVGFMGSGKTTVAQILARRLRLPFFDLDAEIEQASGRTVRAIFESEGEAEFRRREKTFVEGAEQLPAGVFATGGGTFVSQENQRSVLRSGVSVFLEVPFEVLAGRLGAKRDRPLFQDELQARRLLEERLPFYKMASVHLKLNGAESPEDVAELLLEGLDDRTCVI